MNETNWVTGNTTVTEADVRALKHAKKYEKELLRSGYRWFRINARTKVLVECDADGNPTERGKRQIEKQKSLL